MNDQSETQVQQCPSPDCEEEYPVSELVDHVNSEHPGEYQRDDWPDTEAGRAARQQETEEDGDDGE